MNNVYIVEFKKTKYDPISELICFTTKKDYSHTGMIVNDHFYELTESWIDDDYVKVKIDSIFGIKIVNTIMVNKK